MKNVLKLVLLVAVLGLMTTGLSCKKDQSEEGDITAGDEVDVELEKDHQIKVLNDKVLDLGYVKDLAANMLTGNVLWSPDDDAIAVGISNLTAGSTMTLLADPNNGQKKGWVPGYGAQFNDEGTKLIVIQHVYKSEGGSEEKKMAIDLEEVYKNQEIKEGDLKAAEESDLPEAEDVPFQDKKEIKLAKYMPGTSFIGYIDGGKLRVVAEENGLDKSFELSSGEGEVVDFDFSWNENKVVYKKEMGGKDKDGNFDYNKGTIEVHVLEFE